MFFSKNPAAVLLAPFIKFLVISLAIFSLFRVGFIIWQWDRVQATNGLFFILSQGVRFDIISISLLLILPVSVTPLIAISRPLYTRWILVIRGYLCLAFSLLLFIEIATPQFILQFDSRPNILFTEYLKYPKEVISTLWTAYKLQLIFAAIIIPFIAKAVWRYLAQTHFPPLPWWQAPLLSMVLLLLCSFGIRSTLDHRPVNPSVVAFSTDLMVNDLPLNSTYSALYAIYESQRDEKGTLAYGEMDESQIKQIVKQTMGIDPADFIEGDIPTLHRQQATRETSRPLNIVIILEESLGGEFVGRMGGPPLTPNIDSLSKQGIWFENLYATGTRSVRGIEAVITGFTPTPARSVVKLTKSQRDFFSFAQLVRSQGYDTSFLYGGEAHFDNMRRFFMNNGFNSVIDEKDYSNPVFTGSWGVSDEDLFNRAHQEFSAYGDKPFFSLVFTSSNHSPFEFPDNRIELYDKEKATEYNAAKYADYSLGEFFKKAKQSDYWQNTLFLVVADHNSRVRGAELVPIEYFHIPGFIVGGTIEPAVYTRIASQIDLLPTLLSLAGISSEHPATGYDLTRPEVLLMPGRAMMQYNSTMAYMEEDNVAIFEKNKKPQEYIYSNKKFKKVKNIDQALIKKALAHSLFGSLSYNKKLYRLPAVKSVAQRSLQ